MVATLFMRGLYWLFQRFAQLPETPAILIIAWFYSAKTIIPDPRSVHYSPCSSWSPKLLGPSDRIYYNMPFYTQYMQVGRNVAGMRLRSPEWPPGISNFRNLRVEVRSLQCAGSHCNPCDVPADIGPCRSGVDRGFDRQALGTGHHIRKGTYELDHVVTCDFFII